MVKMMITVVLIYAICWLPLHTITLAQEFDAKMYETKPYMVVVWIVSQWLAMSNSCYNPIVYCWMNATYRRGFRYVLRWCPCIKYSRQKAGEDLSRTNTYVTTIRCHGDRRATSDGVRKQPRGYCNKDQAGGDDYVPLRKINGVMPPELTITQPDSSGDEM